MEHWPSSFPHPNQDLAAEARAGALRTMMDSGSIRQRRRFSVDYLQLPATWVFTNRQMLVFSNFHRQRLNLGTDWFKMPLDLGGGMQDYTVRFVEGSYGSSYTTFDMWSVSATLDVLERPQMSDSYLALYLELDFTEAEINALPGQSTSLHTLIHQTLPTNLN